MRGFLLGGEDADVGVPQPPSEFRADCQRERLAQRSQEHHAASFLLFGGRGMSRGHSRSAGQF